MADIKITYETLFDLLRRERNREELQKLDSTFYGDVLAYLAEKQSLLERHGPQDGYNVSADAEKARIQFHNIKRILKELYDRREKKIVMLALNKARTGTHIVDAQALLPEEKRLLDELTALFSVHRADVLETVLRRTVTAAMPAPMSSPEPEEKASPTGEPEEQASSPEEPEETPQPEPEEAPQTEPEETPAKTTDDRIRFTKAVPRFAGGEGDQFGPFSPGDEASLPKKIAAILVRKGRAEQL